MKQITILRKAPPYSRDAKSTQHEKHAKEMRMETCKIIEKRNKQITKPAVGAEKLKGRARRTRGKVAA